MQALAIALVLLVLLPYASGASKAIDCANGMAFLTYPEEKERGYFFRLFEGGTRPGTHTYLKGIRRPILRPRRLPFRMIENLSDYEVNIKIGQDEGELAFHIERTLSIKDGKFKAEYSAMIDGYHDENSKNGPTLKEFQRRVKQIPGLRKDSGDTNGYVNQEGDLLLNWSVYQGGVMVGAIHTGRRETLKEVIDKDVPRIVEMFNVIYPEKKITPEIVKESIAVARESDRVMPELVRH
jgi:hypothetical protein